MPRPHLIFCFIMLAGCGPMTSVAPAPVSSPAARALPAVAAMTSDEIANIRRQIESCWSVPAGARETGMSVVVRFSLKQDGRLVRKPAIVYDKRLREPGFAELADSVIKAVERCMPLTNLPPDKYQRWREMELNFNPRTMPAAGS